MSKSKAEIEEEIDEAYGVLNSLKDGMAAVAVNRRLAGKFLSELFVKLPTVLDAFMVLAEREHKMLIFELIKVSAEMVKGE